MFYLSANVLSWSLLLWQGSSWHSSTDFEVWGRALLSLLAHERIQKSGGNYFLMVAATTDIYYRHSKLKFYVKLLKNFGRRFLEAKGGPGNMLALAVE